MNKPTKQRIRPVLAIPMCVAVLTATGCAERVRAKEAARIDPELSDRFGLGEDAADPTMVDKGEGYYRWKPKPEADGTASPQDPDRRGYGPQP